MKVLVANNYFYLRGGCERVMFNGTLKHSRARVLILFLSLQPILRMSRRHTLICSHQGSRHSGDKHARSDWSSNRCYPLPPHCRSIREDAGRNTTGRHPLPQRLLDAFRRRYWGRPKNGTSLSVLTVHDYKVVCPSYLNVERWKALLGMHRRRLLSMCAQPLP